MEVVQLTAWYRSCQLPLDCAPPNVLVAVKCSCEALAFNGSLVARGALVVFGRDAWPDVTRDAPLPL